MTSVTLAHGWSESLGESVWEQTARVWTDGPDTAVGILMQWGFQDDAIAGRDFRISMRRVQAEWRVDRIEERYHCRRRVSAAGLCE